MLGKKQLQVKFIARFTFNLVTSFYVILKEIVIQWERELLRWNLLATKCYQVDSYHSLRQSQAHESTQFSGGPFFANITRNDPQWHRNPQSTGCELLWYILLVYEPIVSLYEPIQCHSEHTWRLNGENRFCIDAETDWLFDLI